MTRAPVRPTSTDPELDETIDIGGRGLLDTANIGRRIDRALDKKVRRLIEREPERSISVIRNWLRQ